MKTDGWRGGILFPPLPLFPLLLVGALLYFFPHLHAIFLLGVAAVLLLAVRGDFRLWKSGLEDGSEDDWEL